MNQALLPPRSSWIPWSFAGALALVVAVNMGLAWFAVHSAPGSVSERPYEEGLGYDRTLARAAAQDALGWHATVATETISAGMTRLRVGLGEGDGRPIEGATVALRLTRPVGPADATTLRLIEQQPGVYTAAVSLHPGQWDAALSVRRGDDAFAAMTRLTTK